MSVTTWEVAAGHFLIAKERNSVLDQFISDIGELKEEQEEPQKMTETKEEPEPQSINEKSVELCMFQDYGQLLVKHETNTSMMTPANNEIFHNTPDVQQIMETKEEPEPVQIRKEQKELQTKQMIEIKEETQPLPIKEEQVQLWIFQDEGQPLVRQETDSFILIPTFQKDSSEPETIKNHLLCSTRHQQGNTQQDSRSNNAKELKTESKKPRKQGDSVDNSKLIMNKKKLPLCEVCGKSFSTRQMLTVHMRTHTGDNPFSCVTCGKSYLRKHNLTAHMRSHTGEKPHACKMYNKPFVNGSNLPKRRRKKDRKQGDNVDNSKLITNKKKLPLCEVCGKSFSTRQMLTVHMRTHTGDNPFSCVTCGKGFSRNSSLNEHMRTHTGEKPYSCELCDKSFINSSSLISHMRTHTCETRFSCLTCGKKFSKPSSLTKHIRTHTGEKPYLCELCGKLFSSRYKLTAHVCGNNP
ncbi:hypothetical protein XENOCAPTIV_015068 [Xenoophorus captivus]|uniref:C2H2-type domain-containing protein n=1 Tax=Xenoophorus captivus TaxID=1517983 RepID=A0ABV0QRX8_9TELE